MSSSPSARRVSITLPALLGVTTAPSFTRIAYRYLHSESERHPVSQQVRRAAQSAHRTRQLLVSDLRFSSENLFFGFLSPNRFLSMATQHSGAACCGVAAAGHCAREAGQEPARWAGVREHSVTQ